MTPRLVFDEKDRVAAWVAYKVGQRASWGSFYAMGAETDRNLTAGVVFNNFNDSSATAHFACDTFSRQFPELILAAFDYAFERVGLLRLTGIIESNNKKSLALAKRIGFEPEATLKRAGNSGVDLEVLVLWPDNRWKGFKNAKKG